MTTVLHDWVSDRCSWKEQTVLLCAIRGADAGGNRFAKSWTRWIRSTVLRNAAPNKTFMRREETPSVLKHVEESPLDFDMLPVHFFGHLLHALEVIGQRHPDEATAGKAKQAYAEMCEFLHVNQETPEQMSARLADEC